MYCKQCGSEYDGDAKYCTNCGHSLMQNQHDFIEYKSSGNHTHQNYYQTPRDSDYDLTHLYDADPPKIWSPNAIGCWSLFLTPLFGIYLIMKNWKELGHEQEAYQSQFWAVAYFILILIANYLDIKKNGLGIIFLLVWYWFSVKKQDQYIKYELDNSYIKKSILVPVGVTILILVIPIIAIIYTFGSI